MAGSLSHIIDEDGSFTMDLIDNLGDASEALEECFALIYDLAGGDMARVSAACRARGFSDPWEKLFPDEPIPAPMKELKR